MDVARNAVREYLENLMKSERDVFSLSKEDMRFILESFVYGNVNKELKRKIMDNFLISAPPRKFREASRRRTLPYHDLNQILLIFSGLICFDLHVIPSCIH